MTVTIDQIVQAITGISAIVGAIGAWKGERKSGEALSATQRIETAVTLRLNQSQSFHFNMGTTAGNAQQGGITINDQD